MEDGKYTDYLLDWEIAMKRVLDFPLHLMYYEKLKLNTEKELDRLLNFLQVDLDQTLKLDILDACSFERMAREKIIVSKEMAEKVYRNGFSVFRKGKIGDWKNTFTVSQNEMFDDIWKKEMANSNYFEFIYTDREKQLLKDT